MASDHVTKLKLNGTNKYVYLFIANMVSRLSEKYSFNREINDERIQREKILLPVKSDNTPDWQYMEDTMRLIESKQIYSYLQSIKQRV